MRVLPLLTLLIALVAPPAGAETWRCAGDNPGWTLSFDEAQAEFAFPAPTAMDVVQQTAAENRDWPRALTLIGPRDTAIVLVEPRACTANGMNHPNRVLVLTQRGQTPILLSGCCGAPE